MEKETKDEMKKRLVDRMLSMEQDMIKTERRELDDFRDRGAPPDDDMYKLSKQIRKFLSNYIPSKSK